MLPVSDRNKVGDGRSRDSGIKVIIMNNKIELKEKLEHNFLQDAMDDGQKHNDQVFAHNLCETRSG